MTLYGSHRHTPQIDDWAYKCLDFLYSVKDDGKEYDIRYVFQEIGIPRKFGDNVYAIIRQEYRYIDIASDTNKWVSKINEAGIAYVEQRHEEDYQKHGIIPNMQIVDIPLSETFERIFQKHIDNHFQLTWTKATFLPDIPRNLDAAKNMMIEEGILLVKPGNKPLTTTLSSIVATCGSYTEAKKVISEAKNKPQGNSIVMGNGIASIGAQDSSFDLDFHPTQNPPITPTIPEAKHGRINSVIKYIAHNIILVLALTVAGGLIVAFLAKQFGWI